ncbi:MAG: diaminopimelate decarboxylase [Magnetococcales bacterium]|nr:diaminopimelate decarboxylase [Magnetococcales bacterium]NGZ26368.1 diaminopimelate decarboxylase [Magnetococcales bacterium]
MDHFCYHGDTLFCEDVSLSHIAQQVGTPFYCYSEATLLHHLAVFGEAFAGYPHLVCYSVKANSNLAVLDALVRHGAGLDVVSGGELFRGQKVGCAANKMVFSGVGKREDEIRAALQAGILMFNVESVAELHRINRVAGEMGLKAPVALRVNPDVDAKTHPHISTGLRRNKFGIPFGKALQVYRQAQRMPHLQVIGLDCHIGSQVTTINPFVEALKRVMELLKQLRGEGIPIRYLDLGGGLGIPYGQEESKIPPHPSLYAGALLQELQGSDLTLILEPGRVIVGNAGIFVVRVEYIKEGEEKNFIVTDGGMNDMMRPALYDAYHTILPVQRHFSDDEMVADVVGPICESSDFFARERLLPRFEEGDLLAVRSTGAYGFTMSSNYNSRPRVAEVMVRGGAFQVIRRRETLEQLVENEALFAPLAGEGV